MMERKRKCPAWASSKHPSLFMLLDLKPQAYAGPIIVYSKQDVSQLRDNRKAFVEKLLDNSAHTLSNGQCHPEAVCKTPQPTHQILDSFLT